MTAWTRTMVWGLPDELGGAGWRGTKGGNFGQV